MIDFQPIDAPLYRYRGYQGAKRAVLTSPWYLIHNLLYDYDSGYTGLVSNHVLYPLAGIDIIGDVNHLIRNRLDEIY